MPVRDTIIVTEDELFNARESAFTISKNYIPNVQDLLYSENLDDVENGIKKLNQMSNQCWLLSAITTYALVYNQNMYTQSGLTWTDYVAESKKRLGVDKRDLSYQLSSARFFIKYREKLLQKGWTIDNSMAKLRKAEIALELCGDINLTIDHLINDTWVKFKEWYSSYKIQTALPGTPSKNITFKSNKVFVDDIEVIKISEEISQNDRELYSSYIRQIFEILKNGDEPAIISVYDKNEATRLEHLRDKARSER